MTGERKPGQSGTARNTVFVAGPHHIETASGRYVDLLRPDPATITLADIAHHLAQANRYAGACRRPVSVAEHALLVAAMVEKGLGSAIHVALDLPDWTSTRRAAVRAADDWALAAEAWHLLPSKGEGWFCWGLYDPMEDRPLRVSCLASDGPYWTWIRDTWLAEHRFASAALR